MFSFDDAVVSFDLSKTLSELGEWVRIKIAVSVYSLGKINYGKIGSWSFDKF